jgi:hypothetical protein
MAWYLIKCRENNFSIQITIMGHQLFLEVHVHLNSEHPNICMYSNSIMAMMADDKKINLFTAQYQYHKFFKLSSPVLSYYNLFYIKQDTFTLLLQY